MPPQKNIRAHAGPLQALWLALLLCCTDPQIARPADTQSELRQREQQQQQASEMTRKLVRLAFDGQLRQLEENGLASLPLHDEVQSMRQVLERLATTEMQEVARQLADAQRVSPEQQRALIQQASESVRRTVQQMTNQRQILLRRLQMAQLSERLRELVELQTQTHVSTQQLNTALVPQREARAVMTLEDQRNVKTLFVALLSTLHDVATWEGPIGTTSADSMRLLRELEVNQHLADADRTLLVGQFNEASDHQQRILRALQMVLKKLETVQGLKERHQQEWDRTVQQLAESQKNLQQQTHAAALQDTDQLSKLVQDQSTLTHQIQLAAGAAPSQSAAASELERAEKAAAQAAVHMFEQNDQQARAQQAIAMDALRQALQPSQQSPENPQSSQARSAPNGHEQQAKDPATNRWGLLIGEWARAAEALERAAAAQRDLATTAKNVSQAPQGKSEQAPLLPIAQILPTQSQLSQLTNRLSEALRHSAPDMADQLNRIASRMQDGSQALNRKLGTPSLTPQQRALSRNSARKYAQWASALQKDLEQAAQALRSAAIELAAQGPAPTPIPPESPLAAATTGQTPNAHTSADQSSLADIARQLQQQLRDQQAARDQIVQLADQLRELAATTPNPPAATHSPQGAAEASATTTADAAAQSQPSLGELQESQQQFAAAQSVIGQLAAELAQQSELTNGPLLAAMQLASELPDETNSQQSPSSDVGQQDETVGGQGEQDQAQEGASEGGEPPAGSQGNTSTGAAQQSSSGDAGQQDEAAGEQGGQEQEGASEGGEPPAGSQGSASAGAAQQSPSGEAGQQDEAAGEQGGQAQEGASEGGEPPAGSQGSASTGAAQQSSQSSSGEAGQQDEAAGDQGGKAQEGASGGGEPPAGSQGNASTGAAQQSPSGDGGQQDESAGAQGGQEQEGASEGGEPPAGSQGSASTGAAQQSPSGDAGQQDEAAGEQGGQDQKGASEGGEPHAGSQGSASTGAAQQTSSDSAKQSKNGSGKQSKGGRPSSGDRGTASGQLPARKQKAPSGSHGANGKRIGNGSRSAPAAGTTGLALGRGSRSLRVAPRSQPNPSSNSTGPATAGHMGTGLVPASPDVTAHRIAGRIPFAHPMSHGQQAGQDREGASQTIGEQEQASHNAGSNAGDRSNGGAGDQPLADSKDGNEGTSKGHGEIGSKHAAQSKGTPHEGGADGQPHTEHETGATLHGPHASQGTEVAHASHSGAAEERGEELESSDGKPHAGMGHAGSGGREGGLGGGGSGGPSARPLDKPRSIESEAWFAKLPPAVQQSARLRSTRAFPKSYETRLQRYFESAEQ